MLLFFLVILHENKQYRFSSIEGSKILEFSADNNSLYEKIKKGKYIVEISAKQYNPIELKSPTNGEMKFLIKKSLDGKLELTLSENNKKKLKIINHRASMDTHFNKNK